MRGGGGGTCQTKKKFNLKIAGNLAFSQTGSQFVYVCAVDLKTRARKREEKPSMQAIVCAVICACERVFWAVHDMMMSVTGSNISIA